MEKRDELIARCERLDTEVVMGAETHITLNTQTKLNCSCKNVDAAMPNSAICPVCTGQPWAMPQINGEAVKKAILLGKAINADVARTLDIDRKHYEYPDLPAGFQRSQFWNPLIQWWVIQAKTLDWGDVRVDLDHVHIEEDAGKLTHDAQQSKSYIDYNRAWRPLLEVVTQPTIHSLPDLLAYLKQLQRIVKVLGVSEAELAKGFFKSDISISLRRKGEEQLHERTEIKNLSSFKAIQNAVAKEIHNQLVYWEKNNAPKKRQVTVLYDEDTDTMHIMREKENESDYRFMREPNIPSIDLWPLIDEISIDPRYLPYAVEKSLVDVGIRPQDATYFSSDLQRTQCLLSINDTVGDLAVVAKILMNEIEDDDFKKIDSWFFGALVKEYTSNEQFSHELLQELIQKWLQDPTFDFKTFLDEQTAWHDGIIDDTIDAVIEENDAIIQEIQAWNKWKIGSLVGITLWKLSVKVPWKLLKEKIEEKLWVATPKQSWKHLSDEWIANERQKTRATERIDVDALNIKNAYLAKAYQTHQVKEIDEAMIWEQVTISGWIQSIRDHGHLVFIDLRQDWELFQVKVAQEHIADIDALARLKNETVIQFTWHVEQRDEDDYNPVSRTWTIELNATDYAVLNYAQQLPFEIQKAWKVHESKRLAFRYLSLRNEHLRKNILNRSKVTSAMRWFLDKEWLYEIETPLLTKGSDEWSREFIVPSRLHAWNFYVLPQAPQQFKQLLMNADIHKYYQIARCFRDEDPRGDRQPEFTQVDLELAYTSEKEVMNLIGDLLYSTVKKVYPKKDIMHGDTIPVLTYDEAMDTYGTDKPDLRFGLPFKDITSIVQHTNFNIFRQPIEDWWIVKCIRVPWEKIAAVNEWKNFFSGKYKKHYLVDLVQSHGLGWLAYLEVDGDTLEPHMNVEKLGEELCREIVREMWGNDGDTLFFAASEEATVNTALDAVRRELWKKLQLYVDNQLAFCWIVDFPMFEKTDDGQWKFTHNPFSMPKIEHMDRFMKGENIDKIQAQQYDIALNGHEIGWWSIRAHLPHVLRQTYSIMGYSDRDIEKSIGHILKAFSYWTPPHGGIALWLDRILMILQRQPSIRDVIAFPKTWDAKDLLMNAPSTLSQASLDDLSIEVTDKEGY